MVRVRGAPVCAGLRNSRAHGSSRGDDIDVVEISSACDYFIEDLMRTVGFACLLMLLFGLVMYALRLHSTHIHYRLALSELEPFG